MCFYLGQWNMDFYLLPAALPCPAGYTRSSFFSFCPFTMWDLQQGGRLLKFSFSLVLMLPLLPSVSLFLLPYFSFIYLKASEFYYNSTLDPAKTSPCYTKHFRCLYRDGLSDVSHERTDSGASDIDKVSIPLTNPTELLSKASWESPARISVVVIFLLEFLSTMITILLRIKKVYLLFYVVFCCLDNTSYCTTEYFLSHKWELSWNHPEDKS